MLEKVKVAVTGGLRDVRFGVHEMMASDPVKDQLASVLQVMRDASGRLDPGPRMADAKSGIAGALNAIARDYKLPPDSAITQNSLQSLPEEGPIGAYRFLGQAILAMDSGARGRNPEVYVMRALQLLEPASKALLEAYGGSQK